MAEVLVTVVIPTRNRPRLLACTLRSVLAQRGVDVEVIVVDDASTPPVRVTGDTRVRLLRHTIRRGVSAARNSGIAAATGQWVSFCDDDDVWAPDKVSAQVTTALEARAGWVYTGDVAVDENLHILGGAPPPAPHQVVHLLARYNAVPGSASGVAVAARLLDCVGGFDTDLRRTEDWDLWLRLARHSPPACAARPLVAIRQHRENVIVDRASLVSEPALVARRYGLHIDPLASRRRAAWGLLRSGQRLAAAREYAGIAAQGDLKSVGRALVALVHPAVGTARLFGLAARGRDWEWEQQASAWLEPLARECGA